MGFFEVAGVVGVVEVVGAVEVVCVGVVGVVCVVGASYLRPHVKLSFSVKLPKAYFKKHLCFVFSYVK